MRAEKIDQLKASVIISVYKDAQALKCILYALGQQTKPAFEVIVTEDGQDDAMQRCLEGLSPPFSLRHLTQEDIGFRKTRAVNRAIAIARAPYLIFLDGDCIPHRTFVEMHLRHSERNRVCAARRMHLGPKESQRVRDNPSAIDQFADWAGLVLSAVRLHRDHVRNFELGSPSRIFHWLGKKHYLNIVGCNFSCFKGDMEKINGYDEDLPGIGGEDGDLGWRFEGTGVSVKNIKFQAVVYHLHHEARREAWDVNASITSGNMQKKRYICLNGIRKISTPEDIREDPPLAFVTKRSS